MFEEKSLDEIISLRKINIDIIHRIKIIKNLGINFNLSNRPWVAGGCMQKCFSNQELDDSDIDIFCQLNNSNQYNQINKLLSINNYVKISENERVATWEFCGVKVQVIRDGGNSAYGLLGSFDFNLAQCTTDGEKFIYTKKFLRDLDKKQLKPASFVRCKYNTAARVIKYTGRGFKLSVNDAIILMTENRNTTKDLYKVDVEVKKDKSFYSGI